MKSNIHPLILGALLLAAGNFSHLLAAEPKAPAGQPMGREESVLVSITAAVEAIDPKTREVTLKGPLGNMVTFTVDQRVKRLNEVKVGDLIEADYYVSVAAEVRKPTAEERENPIQLLDAAGKAPVGTSPAGGGLRRFKVVTTVEGLDRPTETITVKGPGGNYLTARVADPANLPKLRIGDNIVITYTEALAISLQKAEPKSSE
jgi:Cu/Ag efflux protein CusF